jgi:sugar/nucleoside kinase (ribokinase family)
MKTKPTSARHGLLAGGTWLVEHIKAIDGFLQPTHLVEIHSVQTVVGGSPGNILLTLAACGADFPLLAAGCVGKDEAGALLLKHCHQRGIDTKFLTVTPKATTGFTDAMTERASGRSTGFYAPGANALWAGAELDFTKLKVKWFHLGPLGQLAALDAPDGKFGTKGAKLLAAAQAAGLKTSIALARLPAAQLAPVAAAALKFTDYLIINESEAGLVTGFKVREPDGKLDTVALRHATGALLQQGVRELVVVHFPEGAFARTRRGEDVWQSAVKLPPKLVAGGAGVAEAFSAGCLLGLHASWETPRWLELAVCLAAACQSEPTGVSGIKSASAALALGKKYRFQPPLEPGEF